MTPLTRNIATSKSPNERQSRGVRV